MLPHHEMVAEVMVLSSEDAVLTFADLYDVDDFPTTEDVANLWLYADKYRQAANRLERIINTELASRLEGGSVTVGGWRIFNGQRKDEKCIDTAGFHAWLRTAVADTPDLVERLFNPNDTRVGQLPPTARSTFFEKFVRDNAKKEPIAVPEVKVEEARIKRERQAS